MVKRCFGHRICGVQVLKVAGAANISGRLPSVMWLSLRHRLCISALAIVSLLHHVNGDFSYVQVADQDYLQHGDVSSTTLTHEKPLQTGTEK